MKKKKFLVWGFQGHAATFKIYVLLNLGRGVSYLILYHNISLSLNTIGQNYIRYFVVVVVVDGLYSCVIQAGCIWET